ncbi:1-deoxy-D-xylulose 5-phosphate reductoisomerase [bioreactor metagenome]|uniref:1-deoxy-D-xylulose 5-phosphate reductoisomerase n=1 Tax=bioreactor metagenome TaxID=1076179 RepID=A0A644Z7Z2_9ZZZZ
MHPESVIHSMVEYNDGAIIAQLGSPDMRIPIQYALSYPERWTSRQSRKLDLAAIGSLHFSQPDLQRYPLLGLAYQIGRLQGNMPAVMNAANEEAVSLFLNDRITFLQIEELVMKACSSIPYVPVIELADIDYYDRLARELVRQEGDIR